MRPRAALSAIFVLQVGEARSVDGCCDARSAGARCTDGGTRVFQLYYKLTDDVLAARLLERRRVVLCEVGVGLRKRGRADAVEKAGR